ncbi:hypothetical protein NDU88_011089 [Pleurodeles waltl]|uniref:Uncharacterized protein n=1 Tax=Pleurodeles waltl TaxID=8319 RepID=A0AAV7QW79_PLEWA|nr:hypothetical protein NDU88_011089 [Pleurodeles waltl]
MSWGVFLNSENPRGLDVDTKALQVPGSLFSPRRYLISVKVAFTAQASPLPHGPLAVRLTSQQQSIAGAPTWPARSFFSFPF